MSEARPPSSNRALLWAGVAVLCAWTLLPIYLLALGALGGREIGKCAHMAFLLAKAFARRSGAAAARARPIRAPSPC